MRRAHVYRAALVFLGAFVALMLYLGFFTLFRAPKLQGNALNPRSQIWGKDVNRGGIMDQNGEMLATTVGGQRLYPYGEVASPVTGYLSGRLGSSGLESEANAWLIGLAGRENLRNNLRRLAGQSGQGYDLILSLDAALQAKAMELLGQRRGAVVVMDPRTGGILALASSPSFDPGQVDGTWSKLSQDQEAPLLNRALNGLYPPGSVAKIFTEAVALSVSPEYDNKRYSCPGYLMVQGRKLNCERAHGEVDLQQALEYSCNVAIASLALDIGSRAFIGAAPDFGFNRRINCDLPASASSYPEGDLDANALTEAAIGQGKVLVTPLEIALITTAVANGGVVPEPHLIDSVRDSKGRVTRLPRKAVWLQPFSESVSRRLTEAMTAAVAQGTGRAAALDGISVAGKTGTAENPQGAPHAWFTGFAPASFPQVVVTVILENAGSGGTEAAPVARQILETALSRLKR